MSRQNKTLWKILGTMTLAYLPAAVLAQDRATTEQPADKAGMRIVPIAGHPWSLIETGPASEQSGACGEWYEDKRK